MCGYAVGQYADLTIANLIGLPTLRHGTNPCSWISIRNKGFDPKCGGASFGGDYYTNSFDRRNRTYFTYENSKGYSSNYSSLEKIILKIPSIFLTAIFPQLYISLSTFNYMYSMSDQIFKREASVLLMPLMGVVSLCAMFCFPTLKAHPSQKEVDEMKNDEIIPSIAVYTEKSLPSCNLGIRGIYHNGFTSEVPKRMVGNADRVAMGIFQIFAMLILVKRMPFSCIIHVKSNKIPFALGALLGAA